MQFADLARRVPLERQFTPVNFKLENFRTTPEGGAFGLTAKTQNAELLEWRGKFALEPQVSSSGDLAVTKLNVPGALEVAGVELPFVIPQGEMNLRGSYSVALGEPMQLDVHLPQMQINGLTLRAQGLAQDYVTIPTVVISDTRIAMPANTVSLGTIAAEGVKADVWTLPDGTLNIDQLFAAPPRRQRPLHRGACRTAATAPAAPVSPAAAPAAPAAALDRDASATSRCAMPPSATKTAPSSPWRASNCRRSTSRRPVPASTCRSRCRCSSMRRSTAPRSCKGHGQGRAGAASRRTSTSSLAGFPLQALQPYANGTTDLTITRKARSSADGQVLAGAAPARAGRNWQFEGNATIAGFRSIDNALEQDFFNFERVELSKLKFALAPDSLSIDRVRVVQAVCPRDRQFGRRAQRLGRVRSAGHGRCRGPGRRPTGREGSGAQAQEDARRDPGGEEGGRGSGAKARKLAASRAAARTQGNRHADPHPRGA